MFQVEPNLYNGIWGVVVLIIAAGWTAWALLGSQNQVVFTIMVVGTMLLGGGAAILLKRKPGSRRKDDETPS